VTTQASHVPVLLEPTVNGLNLSPGARVVDGTYGRGGHSSLILEQIGSEGELLVLDQDPEAVMHAQQRFSGDDRVRVVQGNFANLAGLLEKEQWSGSVDGLLLDIGVSSPQLDVASRGFSFRENGHLDMRMDTTQGVTAAEWLRQVSESELMTVIKSYGEERYAKRIAKAIVLARASSNITSTADLAEIVKAAHPRWVHSLEDRIVKHHLRKPAANTDIPRHLPIQPEEIPHPWKVIGKPIKADAEELNVNPRARSAVLRVAQRIALPNEGEVTGVMP